MKMFRQVPCGGTRPIGTIRKRWPTGITHRDSAAGVSMIRFKSQLAAGAALAALSLAGFCLSPANGAVAGAAPLAHPATGVGSCTLKNPDPKLAARNPTKLPLAKHPRPDHRERLPELRVRA